VVSSPTGAVTVEEGVVLVGEGLMVFAGGGIVGLGDVAVWNGLTPVDVSEGRAEAVAELGAPPSVGVSVSEQAMSVAVSKHTLIAAWCGRTITHAPALL
jgi:hypothetical protein